VLHQSIKIVARIGDADYANSGAIPQAAGIEFSDRNVKPGPQTVFQAAHDLTFILERLRRFDVKFEGEEGDQGQFPVSSFQFLVLHADTGNWKLETGNMLDATT